MSDLIHNFMDSQTEEEKKLRQTSMDDASTEGIAIPLKVSGTYLMEVSTYAFLDKTKKVMRVSPEVFVSDTKKSLNLNINLRVVDGTPQAPKGSSLFTNLVLSPAAGADREKIDSINRMLKPKLAVITGQEKIDLSAEWFEEWLIPKYEEKDGKYSLTKDHKMKQQFLVVVEDDVYMDKDTLSVKAFIKASKGSKSVSNAPIVEEKVEGEAAAPSPEDFQEIDPDAAVIPSDEASVTPEASVDGIEDFTE